MKSRKTYFTCLFFLPLFCSAQQQTKSLDNAYRQEIKQILNNQKEKQVCVEKVIPDKATAIAVAEPMLFKVYGKKQILSEMPYVVYFVDDYWILHGTLPAKYSLGGTFEITLSAKDGRVIRLLHGK